MEDKGGAAIGRVGVEVLWGGWCGVAMGRVGVGLMNNSSSPVVHRSRT